jgi:tetratricopeptide (TPR) repeat protein
MQKGFGFVALHQGQVVAHAVIDCIVDGVGDVGLVTAEEYRRRGLATITSAAAVEYGLSHGLELVNWDCSAGNIGSLRTAEKLGFESERDHTLYLVVFDETRHQVNLAWNSLEAGHYQEAIDACQYIIAQQGDAPAYAYFPAACAWAALGDWDQAVQYLNAALDKGWDSLYETTSRKELENLHETPQWQDVLERVQHNRGQS